MTEEQETKSRGWTEEFIRRQREKKQRIRKACVEDRIFRRFPLDKFFSSGIVPKLFYIRQGEKGVRLRFGRLGKPYDLSPDPNGSEINETGQQVKIKRDFPWAGIMKPGFHIVWGFYGLVSEVAVVKDTERTEEIKETRIMAGDDWPVRVQATMHYRVVDPVRAMTEADDYIKTAREFGEQTLSSKIANLTLDQMQNMQGAQANLMLEGDNNLYWPERLRKIGTQITGVYTTEIELKQELQDEFARQSIERRKAIGEANAIVIKARALNEAAILHGEAAKHYKDSPEAREILYAQHTERSFWFAGLEKTIEKVGDAIAKKIGGSPPTNR